jgi:hypothetical protein
MRLRGGLFVFWLLYAAGLEAQDLEPRLYSNAPVGVNFLVAGYAAQEGNVLFDPAIGLENADLTIDGPVVGYARSVKFGGMSGKVDGGIANVCLSGSADYQGQHYTRDTCGWTDAKLRASVMFIGAPAMTLQEFAGNRQNFVVGTSVQITLPVGDYDPARLVNIGTNRGTVKVEIGMAKAVQLWNFEVAIAGLYSEDNGDFFGGKLREQEPVYSMQLHIVRSFASGLWFAIDSTHYRGGRTTVDGTINADFQSNSRGGMTLSLPINRRQSVKVNASRGVSTRTGTEFDTLTAVWQYRWGAGL